MGNVVSSQIWNGFFTAGCWYSGSRIWKVLPEYFFTVFSALNHYYNYNYFWNEKTLSDAKFPLWPHLLYCRTAREMHALSLVASHFQSLHLVWSKNMTCAEQCNGWHWFYCKCLFIHWKCQWHCKKPREMRCVSKQLKWTELCTEQNPPNIWMCLQVVTWWIWRHNIHHSAYSSAVTHIYL